MREGLAALLLVPVAAAGLAVFWVPYRVTGLLARRATRERDVAATAKVFVGAAVYAAWLLADRGRGRAAFGLGAGSRDRRAVAAAGGGRPVRHRARDRRRSTRSGRGGAAARPGARRERG